MPQDIALTALAPGSPRATLGLLGGRANFFTAGESCQSLSSSPPDVNVDDKSSAACFSFSSSCDAVELRMTRFSAEEDFLFKALRVMVDGVATGVGTAVAFGVAFDGFPLDGVRIGCTCLTSFCSKARTFSWTLHLA